MFYVWNKLFVKTSSFPLANIEEIGLKQAWIQDIPSTLTLLFSVPQQMKKMTSPTCCYCCRSLPQRPLLLQKGDFILSGLQEPGLATSCE